MYLWRDLIFGKRFILQIHELADIARYIADTNAGHDRASEDMVFCMEDLKDVLQHNKVEALTVDTFGRRIEKLCRCILQILFFVLYVELIVQLMTRGL